jgi:hypothetical protein
MYHYPSRGFFFIPFLLIGLFLNIQLFFLASHHTMLQQSVRLYQNTLKGFYLAYSGLVYAKVYPETITSITTIEKEDLLNYESSFTEVSGLDGFVSVAKSPQSFYTISKLGNNSKMVLKADYILDKDTNRIIIYSIEKF